MRSSTSSALLDGTARPRGTQDDLSRSASPRRRSPSARELEHGCRAAPRPAGRSRRRAQRDADVALVAPRRAGRDVDPRGGEPRGERRAVLAARARATRTAPWPAGNASGLPRSAAASRSRSRRGGGAAAARPPRSPLADRPQRRGLGGRARRRRPGAARSTSSARAERVAGAQPGHRVRLGERAHDEQALARAASRPAASPSGANSASASSTHQPDRLGEARGAARAGRASDGAPVGSFGRQSTTARVPARAPPARRRRARRRRPAAPAPARRRPRARAAAAGPSRARRRAPRRRRRARGTRRAAARRRRGRPRPARRSTPWRAASASRSAARRVRVGVDRAPQRERGRVDRLGVRRLVPGRAREVERVRPRSARGPLLVAALAQLAPDLLGRELLELAVVVAEAPHQRGASDGAGPSSSRNQTANARPATIAVTTKIRAEHALALVVAGGAPQQPPDAVEPRAQRQREDQRRRSCPKKATAMPSMTEPGPVVDLRADPQPGDRLRAPQRSGTAAPRATSTAAASSASARRRPAPPRSGAPR